MKKECGTITLIGTVGHILDVLGCDPEDLIITEDRVQIEETDFSYGCCAHVGRSGWYGVYVMYY